MVRNASKIGLSPQESPSSNDTRFSSILQRRLKCFEIAHTINIYFTSLNLVKVVSTRMSGFGSGLGSRLVSGLRSGFVGGSGSGLVSGLGLMVSGLGSVVSGLGLILGVSGFTLVFHISDVTVLISGVSDNLDTTVGEGNSVRTGGLVSVSLFTVSEVRVAVIVLHGVFESVFGGNIVVFSGFVVSGSGLVSRSRLVSRSGFVSGCRSGFVGRSGSGLIGRSGSRLVSRSGSGFVSGLGSLVGGSGSGFVSGSGCGLVSRSGSGFVGRSWGRGISGNWFMNDGSGFVGNGVHRVGWVWVGMRMSWDVIGYSHAGEKGEGEDLQGCVW